MTAMLGLYTRQIDFKNAYLNADMKQILYGRLPKRFRRYDENGEMLCLIKKSIYGAKESGHNWHEHLANFLTKTLNFTQLKSDPCAFIREEPGTDQYTIVLTNVDDLPIFATSQDLCDKLVAEIASHYEIDDRGELRYVLGMEIEHTPDAVRLHVSKHVRELVEMVGLEIKPTVQCPMSPTAQVEVDDCPEPGSPEAEAMKGKPFRSVLMKAHHITRMARSDCAQAIYKLSRVAHNPHPKHWDILIHLIKYLAGTVEDALIWPRPPTPYKRSEVFSDTRPIQAHCDADYAGELSTARSTTGGLIKLSKEGAAIDWWSKRQEVVAGSTAEAEYMSMYTCVQVACFFQELTMELGFGIGRPKVLLHEDNTAAIALATGHRTGQRSKVRHMRVRYHRVRDCTRDDNISIVYCPTDLQTADIMTKAAGPSLLRQHLPGLMGYNPSAIPVAFLAIMGAQHTRPRPSDALRVGVLRGPLEARQKRIKDLIPVAFQKPSHKAYKAMAAAIISRHT